MWSVRLFAFAASLSLTVCTEHTHDHPEPESGDPVVEGCKHMNFGEPIPVDTTTGDARIETVHARFDLTLGGRAGNHSGDVLYDSPGGRHYFLFDAPATFLVKTRQGVRPDSITVQPESCPSAALAIGYTLEPGEHRLDFFGVESASLAFVIHLVTDVHDHAQAQEDHDAP